MYRDWTGFEIFFIEILKCGSLTALLQIAHRFETFLTTLFREVMKRGHPAAGARQRRDVQRPRGASASSRQRRPARVLGVQRSGAVAPARRWRPALLELGVALREGDDEGLLGGQAVAERGQEPRHAGLPPRAQDVVQPPRGSLRRPAWPRRRRDAGSRPRGPAGATRRRCCRSAWRRGVIVARGRRPRATGRCPRAARWGNCRAVADVDEGVRQLVAQHA